MFRPIFITGCARSGKNSLAKCIFTLLKDKVECQEYALATELKLELYDFVKEKLGISVFSEKDEDKKVVRPILVTWGEIRRQNSQGRYWVELLTPKLQEDIKNNYLCITTDLRYCSEYSGFPRDELFWAKEEMQGIIIHVSRYDINGLKIQPANEQESKNDPILEKNSCYQVKWPTLSDENLRVEFVENQLRDLISDIENQLENQLGPPELITNNANIYDR